MLHFTIEAIAAVTDNSLYRFLWMAHWPSVGYHTGNFDPNRAHHCSVMEPT